MTQLVRPASTLDPDYKKLKLLFGGEVAFAAVTEDKSSVPSWGLNAAGHAVSNPVPPQPGPGVMALRLEPFRIYWLGAQAFRDTGVRRGPYGGEFYVLDDQAAVLRATAAMDVKASILQEVALL